MTMMNAIDYFDDAVERLGNQKAFEQGRLFMIAYLLLMSAKLSVGALEALGVAKDFTLGMTTPEQLTAARVKCWEYLDLKGASTLIDEAETCAIRAAICCMYPFEGRNDTADGLIWFLDLANRVEDHSSQLEALVREYFG